MDDLKFIVKKETGKDISDREAINEYYESVLGQKTPKGATVKDIAKIMKAEDSEFRTSDSYKTVISQKQAEIKAAKEEIRRLESMSLEELYKEM